MAIFQPVGVVSHPITVQEQPRIGEAGGSGKSAPHFSVGFELCSETRFGVLIVPNRGMYSRFLKYS